MKQQLKHFLQGFFIVFICASLVLLWVYGLFKVLDAGPWYMGVYTLVSMSTLGGILHMIHP